MSTLFKSNMFTFSVLQNALHQHWVLGDALRH